VTLLVCKRNLVEIFYHNRQVAACVAKLDLGGASGTHILEEGEVVGSAMVSLKKNKAIRCGHCTISNHLVTICHQMSLTLKSAGSGSLWG